ncbi:MAG: FecR domain-containing protein [Ferrovibrio sp.]|uniref:FecR family protein n=1 Tax=Ferrovibrio sp. TaxID=1917215 RepID=UPI00261D724C|nr:FecR domain-containing protein [Ferrovibrio sp.]MCW0233546.1 FecR domain-containing protein [Ferrovibrio sp.]
MTARPASAPVPADQLDAPLDPLSETALEWLVRLHDGTAGEADWAAYDSWQAAGPEHRSAALRAERLWEGLGAALHRPRRRTRPLLALLLVGLGLLGLGAALLPDGDISTATGERRQMTLADGSALLLDAETSLDIEITPEHRRLHLHRGALHVTVAPDPARPFEVIAAGTTTRALGTAFEVRRRDDSVQVTVTEHAVRVSAPDGSSRAVQSGQSLRYGPATGLQTAQPANLASLTAWQRGRLVFDGQPLGDVVADMQRYRRGLILISDARLRALPVTGVFATGDSDGLVEAIAASLPVRVLRLPLVTVIRPIAAAD